jgi:chloramphenicol O-acetyltransferase
MDWDLWTRLYKSGAVFRYVHKPLSVTRIYPETKTSGMSLERYREINAHLKKHSTLLHRMVTLIGNLRYDLSENDRSFLMSIVFTILNIAQRVKNLFFSKQSKKLYGIEITRNYIHDSCFISLPWYDTKSPQYAVLMTHQNASVALFLDGNPLELQKSNDEQLFLIPKSLRKELKITWNFEIHVEQPTRLITFKLV